nr:hypothetical protein [Tanacetum cinerariifolium]
VNTPRSDDDRLELMELMVFLTQKGGCDELGLSAARLSKFLLSGKLEVPDSYYSSIFERQKTSWNEFSIAMASAVICLSKGQRFNFSRYIFDSLARNVDSSSKFYMYPRFIQLIIQAQVVDFSSYTTRYISPPLTQKVFANMRRVRKGCSGIETPLFENMLEIKEEDAEEEVQVSA